MEMFINITSQGQISIPASIRRDFGFSKKILVRTFSNKLILEPAPDLLLLAGALKSKAKRNNINSIIKEEKRAFASSFHK